MKNEDEGESVADDGAKSPAGDKGKRSMSVRAVVGELFSLAFGALTALFGIALLVAGGIVLVWAIFFQPGLAVVISAVLFVLVMSATAGLR
jgi:hypothetical protein